MQVLDRLKGAYPNATCELEYNTEFELLISVILSAQCTDKRVNIVTRTLFCVANTPQAFCDMPIETLESYIKSCGLYRNKAANIKACCADIVKRFGGQVPKTREELMSLAGVGRKTANVILSVAYGTPAIAVDTHVFRVAHRLGLAESGTPDGVERELCAAFPPEEYKSVHFLFIRHGRDCCKAQRPLCGECPISNECKYFTRNK